MKIHGNKADDVEADDNEDDDNVKDDDSDIYATDWPIILIKGKFVPV